jgi:predicted GNAT superfamily acetyltransferase
MEPLVVRPCETVADYVACQQAQRLAWGLVDESYVVPLATMVGAQHHGGLVLGAFTRDGTAAGLSFAFLGQVEGRWCLYSQLTGIIPGYQGQGIGSKIKTYQRLYARSKGLEFIAWSFDPLQAGNAYFNLRRLGATSNRYLTNMYGLRTDALNAGVPTDRLIAEWPTEESPVRSDRAQDMKWPLLVEGPIEPNLTPVEKCLDEATLLVEIPADITKLRATDAGLAEAWRDAIAQSLSQAFEHGYRASDVIREGSRSFYLLSRSRPA